jgi:hypothetical protein
MAIHHGAESIESKIRIEAEAAERIHRELDDAYSKIIADLTLSLTEEVHSIFNNFDHQLIPMETSKVNVISSDIDEFFLVTVPENVSKQSGQVVTAQIRLIANLFHN